MPDVVAGGVADVADILVLVLGSEAGREDIGEAMAAVIAVIVIEVNEHLSGEWVV